MAANNGRPHEWQPDEGTSHVDVFRPIIGLDADEFFYKGVKLKSKDFKVGIDNDAMFPFRESLGGLIDVDPRGGYFNQEMVEDVMGEFHNDLNYAASVRVLAGQKSMSAKEMQYDQAYMTRVMLSHIRIKASRYYKAVRKNKKITTLVFELL